MLNSVGIPSPGIDRFLVEVLPKYLEIGPPVIVSIGGLHPMEYFEIAKDLGAIEGVAALEVNVSCPNLEAGGLEIGSSPAMVERVIAGVVEYSSRPVIAKLTPNVTRIEEIARAAEVGGATAISAINTLVGTAIDSRSGLPVLGSGRGGVSGPPIKPIAIRMVSEIANAVSIPVIGVGGIATASDAREFFNVGAIAVQVGTANFNRPDTMDRMVEELQAAHGSSAARPSTAN
jgi:dihydroorotate dehydrogenase (NAD+) catalytic subunit